MPNELLTSLLKDVSRSFYLTLRVLPREVRSQIGLAYLLARTTDTVADTEVLPLEARLEALDKLRRRILGIGFERLDFRELIQSQASGPEQILLQRCEETLLLLSETAPADRQYTRDALQTI